jgi:ComF family protein
VQGEGCFIRFVESILNLIFPPRCVNCRKTGDFFCPKCRESLVYLPQPVCIKCSEPITSGAICHRCQSQKWDIDGIRSVFQYEGAIRQAVIQFKYHNVKALAEPLARLMTPHLELSPLNADLLVPVPSHPQRLRERGYNQAALLASKVSEMTSIPLNERTLVRTKNTSQQAKTDSLAQRIENMTDAFACRSRNLSGKRILLVDDVCTSGTTLNACAAPLKAAGAASVHGVTLAKEI